MSINVYIKLIFYDKINVAQNKNIQLELKTVVKGFTIENVVIHMS